MFSVLLLASISLVTLMSLFIFSIDNSKSVLTYKNGDSARSAAESCVELALGSLALDPEQTSGSGLYTFSDSVSCQYVFSGSGDSRSIVTNGVGPDTTIHISANVLIGEVLSISSWEMQ